MSNKPLVSTTRRGFLSTATAATALTLTAPPAAEGQAAKPADQIQTAQLTTTGQNVQPAATGTGDWTRPAAMTIPKEGYFKRRRPLRSRLPRTPANHGFTVIAKVKPGREIAIREYGKTIQQAVKDSPNVLAPLRLHYLRWVLFDVGLRFALHVSGHLRYRF